VRAAGVRVFKLGDGAVELAVPHQCLGPGERAAGYRRRQGHRLGVQLAPALEEIDLPPGELFFVLTEVQRTRAGHVFAF
jgi:hypothetical protein